MSKVLYQIMYMKTLPRCIQLNSLILFCNLLIHAGIALFRCKS